MARPTIVLAKENNRELEGWKGTKTLEIYFPMRKAVWMEAGRSKGWSDKAAVARRQRDRGRRLETYGALPLVSCLAERENVVLPRHCSTSSTVLLGSRLTA